MLHPKYLVTNTPRTIMLNLILSLATAIVRARMEMQMLTKMDQSLGKEAREKMKEEIQRDNIVPN
jgi:hypothetical protein